MTTQVLLRNLASRVVRSELTKDSPKPGFKHISSAITKQNGESGGLFNTIKNLFGRGVSLVGWIVGGTFNVLGGGAAAIWGAVVQVSSFVYNFNWNITDQQIDQRFSQLKQIVAGQAGEIVGNSVGYLACGVLPSAVIATYNEPLGVYLLREVGEEALDEFCDNFASFLNITFRSVATSLAYSWFKNGRKAWKFITSPNNPKLRNMARNIYGDQVVNWVDNWNTENSKPWSFRLAVEERIDKIQNPIAQEFVEEFYDEFKDACVEAGYVVANSLDSWVLQQNELRRQEELEENIVELVPNREAPDETIILQGNLREIKTQSLIGMNTYNLIESRDIGDYVGEPLAENVKRPIKDVYLKIHLRGKPKPPFKDDAGNNSKRTQIEIPNVDRAKINWKEIKQAVGSTSGYLWGRYLVSARLKDENYIKFYAASEEEGERILNKLLKLTKSELSTLNIHEEKKSGDRKKFDKLYKETTRVYPTHVSIINQYKILTEDEGRASTKGHLKRRKIKFKLYTDNKPADFDTEVNNLFLT